MLSTNRNMEWEKDHRQELEKIDFILSEVVVTLIIPILIR